ncbi:FAD-dependent oxidoreductase [Streptomyces luteoverticillatus]|uniref:FAD-dependent oxidoreductase n=1 Tax=Streptomyces luteoverticillatus TaxID=66425 RepID=A0A3Q9FUF3_STRLT|nr:FAD-dependent monooxygenase [Streptomyces luteoverticillatus]AZQ70892.1 FAD-dependent oxidoreductase [Streptomyces luteoverticillatus]
MDTDVIVVGAGPTGLTVANELGLAGVRAVVLERLPERTGQSKALNLQPRTAEMLDMRGWLDPVLDRAVTTLPGGHFAGIPLDYTALDTAYPYQVGIPQARVEEFLEAHLATYGIPVLRGHELAGLTQDADGVTATVTGPDGTGRRLRAAYLVGADGGRSRVRKELGVGFPGRDGRYSLVVADIVLADDSALPTDWRLPNPDEDDGDVFLIPLGDGVHRFLFAGPEQQKHDKDDPVTDDEVRAALATAKRFRPQLLEVRWASRFTDAARQAERYVSGRVALAGDAAHVHLPAGGQGMNLGVQDAFNLGWKLAAAVRGRGQGRTPERLLDTYHSERHPVGADVLANTRAQGVMMWPDDDVRALRGILGGLLAMPEANRRIAGMISGIDIRYDMPGAPGHPLLGARLPVRLTAGRGALLGPDGGAALPWAGRVDMGPAPEGVAGTVLVRPDGYVCWAGPAGDGASLRAALERWFGPGD